MSVFPKLHTSDKCFKITLIELSVRKGNEELLRASVSEKEEKDRKDNKLHSALVVH